MTIADACATTEGSAERAAMIQKAKPPIPDTKTLTISAPPLTARPRVPFNVDRIWGARVIRQG